MQSSIQVTNSFFKKIRQIKKILPTLDMGDLRVILEPLIHVKQGTENLFFFKQARNKLKPNKSIKISILKVIAQPRLYVACLGEIRKLDLTECVPGKCLDLHKV